MLALAWAAAAPDSLLTSGLRAVANQAPPAGASAGSAFAGSTRAEDAARADVLESVSAEVLA